MSTNLLKQTDEAAASGTLPTLNRPAGSSLTSHDALLTRPLTVSASGKRCPHCDSIVYSRRHKLCGVCSRPLPEDFLFSSQEARRLESLLRSEQRRHRQWMAKAFRRSVGVLE